MTTSKKKCQSNIVQYLVGFLAYAAWCIYLTHWFYQENIISVMEVERKNEIHAAQMVWEESTKVQVAQGQQAAIEFANKFWTQQLIEKGAAFYDPYTGQLLVPRSVPPRSEPPKEAPAPSLKETLL